MSSESGYFKYRAMDELLGRHQGGDLAELFYEHIVPVAMKRSLVLIARSTNGRRYWVKVGEQGACPGRREQISQTFLHDLPVRSDRALDFWWNDVDPAATLSWAMTQIS